MPTVKIEARLIRLKEELLVERGHYLLIYPDDRIVQLTPDEARKLVDVVPEARKIVNHRNRGPASPTTTMNGRSVVVDVNGRHVRLGQTTFQVLQMLLQATHDNTIWARGTDIKHESSSARLVDLREKGLAVSKSDGQTSLLWQLTNNGLSLLRAVERQEDAQT